MQERKEIDLGLVKFSYDKNWRKNWYKRPLTWIGIALVIAGMCGFPCNLFN